MRTTHVPAINARYWTGITLASIFGTNLGDFYAHESGLSLIGGVPILVALFFLVYFIERLDKSEHDGYYWLCIIIMRTGATNIADYLTFGMHINAIGLSVFLAILLAALAWAAARSAKSKTSGFGKGLPDTNGLYWGAMLTAGVFGTVLGDVCSHTFGGGTASIGLGAMLAAALIWGPTGAGWSILHYWLTIAVARTAGTAIGDWLAGNKIMNLGLPLSTLLTGLAFAGVLLLWRSRWQTRPALAR
jgi:uncharacterized membrane-anchored protein